MTYKIFICYKRKTAADLATHLKVGLEELGHQSFLDTEDIPKRFRGNKKWSEYREKALLESEILLLIVTPGVEKSDEIRKELTLAIKSEKEIMCLRHAGIGTDMEIDLGFKRLNLRELNQIPFDTKEDLLRKVVFNVGRKAPIIPKSRPSYISFVAKLPSPLVDFRITQIIGNDPRNRRRLPDVGFNLRNLNDYSIKAKVKTFVYLGGDSKGLVNSKYYNGRALWNLNPYHTVFGHFNVPDECVDSKRRLSIQADITVIDPNGYEYEFLPVSWTYMRNENKWFFEPRSMKPEKDSIVAGHDLQTTRNLQLKNRIREDLSFIVEQITHDLEKEAFQSRAFPIDVFLTLQKDLMLALDIATFRVIQEAYVKIDGLRFPSNLMDVNKKNYKEAMDHINKALEVLS